METLGFDPENARLKLFPVLTHRISQEDYMAYRVGGSKITTVATSRLGIQVIRMLKTGRTIGEIKEILGKRLGVADGQLDLMPVLEAIFTARMVRKADDQELETERPALRRILFQSLQFLYQLCRAWGRDALIKCLPPKSAYRFLCFVKLAARRRKVRPLQGRVYRNIRQTFGSILPEHAIRSIAAQHGTEQVQRAVDNLLLRNLPPRKMVHWLCDSARFTGLEQLQEAQAAGRGAILCGFHFGAPQLLVPLLWRAGISFTGAAAMPPFRGKALASKIVLDGSYCKKGVPGCGTVTWYTKFSFRGFLEMMRAVERGETVLVFPDGYFERPNREIARYFGHLAAEFSPARSSVRFLGRAIPANLMVPWLCQQTRAPLFPVKLLRSKSRAYEVVIEPPLNLFGEESLQESAQKLYGMLERDIHLHPASWNYWDCLHQLAASSQAAAEEPMSHLATASVSDRRS
jgi:lauroyl/myristoyl acyltransferase